MDEVVDIITEAEAERSAQLSKEQAAQAEDEAVLAPDKTDRK